ncbi:hypothetical protein [Microbacterium natoriense]
MAPSTPEDEELTRLRARAYGREADIQADPDALRRLEELENATGEASSPGEPQTPSTEEEPAANAQHDAEPVPSRGYPSRFRLSRRTLGGVWISSVVLAGIGGGVLGAAVAEHDPSVIAVLSEAKEQGVPTDPALADFPDPIRFQDYLGLHVIVYTMTPSDDSVAQDCIAVGDSAGGARGGCLPEALDAIAVIEVNASSPQVLRESHPVGSIIQFTHVGDHIEVRASE